MSNPMKSESLKLILNDFKEYIKKCKNYEIKGLMEALVWYFEEHKMVFTLGDDLDSEYIINIYVL